MEILIYISKTGIYLLIFLLVYVLFLRKTTFFHFNRLYLFSGLILSFILPFYQYSYNVYLSTPVSTMSQYAINGTSSSPETGYSVIEILLIIYSIGVCISLIRSIYFIIRFRKMLKGKVVVKQDKYKIISDDTITAPFTVIDYIFINTNKLTDIEKRLILEHEKAHIDQYHWIDLIISEIVIVFQWFNPLVRRYIKIQKENHEFLADKAVIDMNYSPAIYRAVLINQQFNSQIFAFSNSFNVAKPINRLKMITKRKTSPWRKIAVIATLPFITLFIWASAKPNYVYITDNYQINNITQDIVTDTVTKKHNSLTLSVKEGEEPQLIIDGKVCPYRDFEKLDPKTVIKMGLLKKESAVKAYGEKAKYGALVVTTKAGNKNKEQKETSNKIEAYGEKAKNGVAAVTTMKPSYQKNNKKEESVKISPKTLVIIDGEEKTYDELISLNPTDIKSMSIIKDEGAATGAYGDKAKHGVIIIESNAPKN